MPYNVFYIAFFAILLGIVIALLSRFGRPAEKPHVLPELDYDERKQHEFASPVGAEELRSLATRLLQRYGIEVESEARNSEREFCIMGSSEDRVIGGRYAVQCDVAAEDEVLPPERVLEFRDFVKAQGLTRGIFLTTGYFARESRFLVEDAPISLLSRGEVKRLLEDG